MRSAIHHRFGDPAEVLAPGQSPVLEPGPGEVRIRMRLAPIHNHDLWTVRGQYGYKPTLPAIGGSEGLGIVDALGAGVDGLEVGQRVTAASARGAWAEYFLAPARMVVPMPDAIPDEVFKHVTVKGFWGSRVGRDMPASDQRRLIGELVQRAASGELRLPVDSIHDLAHVAQAVAASLRPARGGKVLLRA